MKILFLTHYCHPHIGGVETHIRELSNMLRIKGENITILTSKHYSKLRSNETINGIKVIRFSYPHIKIFGLLAIWVWLWKHRQIIRGSDVIHCHDVFIWYLPFRFLYPWKKVYTTLHGWEGVWPIPLKNILLKRMAAKLSTGTIAVGRYIEKYYGIKADKIIYGGI